MAAGTAATGARRQPTRPRDDRPAQRVEAAEHQRRHAGHGRDKQAHAAKRGRAALQEAGRRLGRQRRRPGPARLPVPHDDRRRHRRRCQVTAHQPVDEQGADREGHDRREPCTDARHVDEAGRRQHRQLAVGHARKAVEPDDRHRQGHGRVHQHGVGLGRLVAQRLRARPRLAPTHFARAFSAILMPSLTLASFGSAFSASAASLSL